MGRTWQSAPSEDHQRKSIVEYEDSKHNRQITCLSKLSLYRMDLPVEATVLFKRSFRSVCGGAVPQVLGNTFLNALSSDTKLSFAW